MAYWWVSQNQTYRQERDGGYLWAPKSGSGGVVFAHWSNMTLVRPDDVIFSYARQFIGALGLHRMLPTMRRNLMNSVGPGVPMAGRSMSSIGPSIQASHSPHSWTICFHCCLSVILRSRN